MIKVSYYEYFNATRCTREQAEQILGCCSLIVADLYDFKRNTCSDTGFIWLSCNGMAWVRAWEYWEKSQIKEVNKFLNIKKVKLNIEFDDFVRAKPHTKAKAEKMLGPCYFSFENLCMNGFPIRDLGTCEVWRALNNKSWVRACYTPLVESERIYRVWQ